MLNIKTIKNSLISDESKDGFCFRSSCSQNLSQKKLAAEMADWNSSFTEADYPGMLSVMEKIVVKYLSKGYNVELPFGSLPFSFSTPFGIHFFLFLGYNLCKTWGDFMKKILIFGHKNPDTDSIVSSTALEFLKKKMGFEHYSACRAGHLNPQTDYIYKKFGISTPLFIPDLLPKVEYFMHKGAITTGENESIWNAVSKMRDKKVNVLPVVDKSGLYKGLISSDLIFKSIFDNFDPMHHLSLFTSAKLLKETLKASFLSGHNLDSQREFKIILASTSFSSFSNTLKSHLSQPIIVVTGDREDIQLFCLENKVDILIITGSRTPGPKVIELAKKIGTTIILSPLNTSSTSMLIMYSVPVFKVANTSLKALHAKDLLTNVKKEILSSPLRLLPVVDDENKVIGIMSEIDLHNEPDLEIALVDHNELSQAVDGIENYTITEIIDHHRIGPAPTKSPITFINMPLGSTSTIISKLFIENKIEIPVKIASLLLSGILSDTLILKSATTTQTDVEIAKILGKITGLEIQSFGEEIIKAGSRIKDRTALQIIAQDLKEYTEAGETFTVSQIEVDGTQEILRRKEEFIAQLEEQKKERKALFSALLVTDISNLNSLMLIAGEKKFMDFLHFPKVEEQIFFLKDVVSRKKQLIPIIGELIGEFENY